MTDFERINGPRVEKIVKMLEVIETSAKSNKAMDELAALLAPVSRKLEQAPYQTLGQAMSQTLGQAPSQKTGRSPAYIDIREAAKSASLKDLTYAMAVYINRIDEELS
jgi:hypothetical protein